MFLRILLALGVTFCLVPVLVASETGGHPPEVHTEHSPEPVHERLCWMMGSALIGYLVFRGGETLYKLATARRPVPESAWGWQGAWISLDSMMQMVIPADSTESWTLFRGGQAFELLVLKADATAATAEGWVKCTAVRHVRHRFSIAPAVTDENKLELKIDDKSVGVFKRPE